MRESIETTPGFLDDFKMRNDFDYFTINRGKAKYHYLTLADNSCGIYYAWRQFSDGSVGARRAIEPTTNIWFISNIKTTGNPHQ